VNLDTFTGLASTPRPPVPGALNDDPLTSPSFSLKAVPATDSRSYGHARKSAEAGHESGGYYASPSPPAPRSASPDPTAPPYVADYASGGYAYPAEPAASGQWYAAPPDEPAPAPAYANPYNYPSPGTSSSAGHAGDAGRGSYLADPLRVYSPPAYEPPVSAYPDPASAPYQPLPAPGMAAPSMEPPVHAVYPGAYPEQPYEPVQGQPEPAPYQDGYAGAGYTPGYENGYSGDPYSGGGLGGYQPQG
jgi:hypothetical protein